MRVLYRFEDNEAAVLLHLATRHAKEVIGEGADFVEACRIVSELSQPTPSMRDALAPGIERTANHLGIDMVEAAQREGIDIEKELGAHDPRARHPRCIHGRKFSEPCTDCTPPAGDVRAFEVSPEERAALDEALANRTAQLTPEFARRHEPRRAGEHSS